MIMGEVIEKLIWARQGMMQYLLRIGGFEDGVKKMSGWMKWRELSDIFVS